MTRGPQPAVLIIAAALIGAAAVGLASTAQADEPDIYGLITSDEQQEIWANGHANCVALDRIVETEPPVTSEHVRDLVQEYLNKGWDLESAGDIIWESVEGRCPEYNDQVKRGMRSYGPMD